MALWKESTPAPTTPPPASPAKDTFARDTFPREPERSNVSALTPEIPKRVKDRPEMKESVIASDLTIEGKIVGSGHVRIAGRFKGDVQVDGNLGIEAGAHLEGQVRAQVVTVAGELKGNIENAKRVELLEGGIITGDVKAGSLTVAAGSRMRGQVEFGWEDEVKAKGIGAAQ
ncbi:MAG: polymer-forming cytoskeletal protein [Steroidobacteraceae bacterium]|nr:polymer-forming cytoskeletal protein [Steroidobacteraceae bacterium]